MTARSASPTGRSRNRSPHAKKMRGGTGQMQIQKAAKGRVPTVAWPREAQARQGAAGTEAPTLRKCVGGPARCKSRRRPQAVYRQGMDGGPHANKMMRVLGIDCGSRVTGYGVI